MALSLGGLLAAYLIGAIPVGHAAWPASRAASTSARSGQRQYRRHQCAPHARAGRRRDHAAGRRRQGLCRGVGGRTLGGGACLGRRAGRWRRWSGTAGRSSSAFAAVRVWPPRSAPFSPPRPGRWRPRRWCFAALTAITQLVSLGVHRGLRHLRGGGLGRCYPSSIALAATVVAAIIVVRHRANIQRLRAGTESRLGRRARLA